METSEKIQDGKISENTHLIENDDLHIVGFKVNLDGEEAYTFALDKAKSKSADVLTITADSNKLKLTSTCKENRELEVHIKSKNYDKDPPSESESLCCYDIRNQLDGFSNTNPQSSYHIKSPKQFPFVPLKHITEVSTSGTQTESETLSTSTQTTYVEVRQPRYMQENTTQTDRINSVSTATDAIHSKSVETQTDGIQKKQVEVQTHKEATTGSSQTETAAIYSIDKEYDKSTQTEQTEDVGTSTDFDIYIVDRQNVTEKSVDTEDLPFSPLIVAKAEKKGTNKVNGQQICNCTCGHRNHDRCIYKCCFHKEYANFMPRCLTHCPYQQCLTFPSGIPQCDVCHCPPTRNCDSNCNENFRFDVHQLHCCKCKNLDSRSNSEENKEKVERLKELRSIDEVNYGTSAVQTYEPSPLEIGKSLEKELKKISTIMAVSVRQPLKVETVGILEVPVIFEHVLESTSFEFSTYRQVVNPLSIASSVNDTKVSEKEPEECRSNVKFPKDENLKETHENYLLTFLDEKKEKPVVLSQNSRSLALAGERHHPRVCLCNKCSFKVHGIVQERQFCEQSSGSTDKEDKPTSKDERGSTSTSPKIKRKGFNYMSKDMWKPYDRNDGAFEKKVQAIDIIYAGQSSSDESFESVKMGLMDACEVVNDHILSLRPVDETAVRKAAETLHRQWFESAGSKYSDLREVRNYMQYFKEYSNNLLKTLLHSVDNNGNNVLHFAFANNRFDLAEEFLNYGLAADLLKPNKSGNSPLMICSISQPKSRSHWSVVRRTFELGDVNTMSVKSGQTPLMHAASCGFQAMVDLLLEIGANPNLQDTDGSTALMYAAEHGHEKCIKSIVKHEKWDPTITDKDGQTACSIALNNGHKNIAVLIHTQALEKRQLSKNSYPNKRYIWTGSQTRW